MRVVLAAAMLAAFLSGCAGGSDKDGADVLPEPTVDALNRTVNHAPTANLTSDAASNGTAPLNVTFSIEAFDADGDGLTWTLTLGNVTLGNGTSLPAGNASAAASNGTASGSPTDGNVTAGNATAGNATGTVLRENVTHQFAEPGNYTVVLNVTDGTNSTVSNVTVTVLAGGGGEAPATVGEDAWVVFNPDGTCDAKGEFTIGPGYVHERGDPPGTGYLAGDGTWVYEESNGVDGLQVGGAGEIDVYADCLNPDTLVF